MMSTLTRNIVMVCSLAVLCAALVGCSSSGDDNSADLQRQLDMEKTARMMAEQEGDTAKAAQAAAEAAQMAAEQNLTDTRVALAAADKVRDAAAYGVEKVNRVGDITIISKRDGWDSTNNITGWRSHLQANNSGSKYTAMSQSYRDGSLGFFTPWYDEDGNLLFVAGAGLAHKPLQTDPEVWPFRSINTSFPDGEGRTTSQVPIDNHGLGAAWQGIEAMRAYEEGGTLTLRLFTDLTQSDNPGDPYVSHPAVDATYPNIVLDDHPMPAIPAGWDGQWIGAGNGLRGSLDGASGTFSCAAGDHYYCGLEAYIPSLTPGYFSDVAADPVIFTPDDGSGEVRLPHPEPTEVPTVNYLTFGSWLFVPEDITDLDAYDFGVFASGDDPFTVDNLQGLTGTADYAGEAAGTYADVPDATISSFNAKVELTANFGAASDFGAIEGRVYEFDINGRETSPLTELGLYTAPWREGGATNIFQSWEGGPPYPGGWVDGNAYADTGTAKWRGSWGGKFFGNGSVASDLPNAFAGTFGATDGDHTFAGSFGARQQ